MNKYHREVMSVTPGCRENADPARVTIDVYSVIEAFGVSCPATQHAIKKLLCAGVRGHKNTMTDLREAAAAIDRAIQLEAGREKSKKEDT